MAYKAINNASALLAVGLSPTDTTVQVATGKGDLFPVITAPDHTYVSLENAAGAEEIMKVTARTLGSDSMTVVRAQDGTTAKTWLVGDIVECRPCSAVITDLQAEFAAADAAHVAAAGAHAASAISVTPVGNVVSTDVQSALAELDTEKQPLDATLTAIANESLGAFSHRNKIINGGFAINQRVYASGAATTAGQYTLDRWKVTGTAGITFITTANKTTVTIPAAQALQQVVEGLNLQSGTYVLSWEGTAQGKIGAGALSASGITGAIVGGTNTTIEFAPGTVANIQLEVGSVATPFEQRLDELALCKKYARRFLNDHGSVGAAMGASIRYNAILFDVEMRAAPTLTGVTSYSIANVTAATTGVIVSTGTTFIVILSDLNGLVAGDAAYIAPNQEGFLSAEL